MVEEILGSVEDKMKKALGFFDEELGNIRGARAQVGLVDSIKVDAYGQEMVLKQIATVSTPDARTIMIQPWDKALMASIEKAIRESDLGLNPATMGDLIRVPMPALTEERRKELVKVVKHEGENAKIAVRNIRRDANEHLKKMLKDKETTEDEERRAQDDVQKMTDKFVAEIDKLVTQKEADIMTV